MKRNNIIYWVTTIIIVVFEGVIPAFTSQTKLAKEGISHLGYPEYFGNVLVVFKVAGALLLLIPAIPARVKEWAYAGFAFDFLFASISYVCVEGVGGNAFFPVIFLVILIISNITYYKRKAAVI